MSNYLKDKTVYLSGSIEFDKGVNWRPEVIKQLKNRFGLIIIDPFSDPKQQKFDELQTAKKNKDYDTITKIARGFLKKDLQSLSRSDFVIVMLKYGVSTYGTTHEIINATHDKKPVLLVTDTGDITNIPSWFYGFINTKYFFNNFDEIYQYLEEVNQGQHVDNERWAFICNQL